MSGSSSLQKSVDSPPTATPATPLSPPINNNGTAPIEIKSPDQMLSNPEIQKVMNSDVAINALLSRLKQSLLTCEEFTKFIRKKYVYEEEHVEELAKQFKHFFVDASGSSLKRRIHDVLEFDGKLAQVKRSYVTALEKMYDEMSALLFTMTKMRKSVKENSRRLEKEVADAIHSAEKAQARYNSLCQDWDKLRMTDPTKTKLTLRGSKTTKEQEEELLRKIDNSDLDYKQKVDYSDSLRNTFITRERPKIVLELKDLILEIDTAMSIQLQKYTIWTENLILNSGVTVTPFDSTKSMKSIASSVTNEKDLYDFLNRYNNTGKNGLMVNKNLIPVGYKRHPSMAKGFGDSSSKRSPPIFAVNPTKNSIPKRIISTHNETPFTSSPSTPSMAGSTNTSFKSPNLPPKNSVNSAQREPKTSSEFSQLHVTNEASISSNNDTDPRSKTLDPGNSNARLPSLSTTVSMATAESDRPLSHIQTNNSMPPGTQKNFKTFGVPIENLVEFEQDMVPAIVRQCIYVIDKYGLDLEGIYRKSANVLDVSKLKEEIDRDPSNVAMILPPKNYTDSDIYLVGSLLKAFFAALPSSLLPEELGPEIKTCLSIPDQKTRKNYMHGLIYKLPDAQYWTLRALLFHLKRVADHESQNRMNLKSLNIIWGPTIISPNEDEPHDVNFQIGAMEVLLDVADQAFEAD
ncbi:GTPase-activating protein RGD1 TDEL_0D02100 [Torulaspora delbrueckii]|uniref:Rho-GAP domain-containing protein n=1 Tax=Torulaspora delbrueckii TaxID=4950 RepID=G8ZT50_TORDE|nr:hypothetical protein TDEL_0D02100 [Torulaspora delbrueckii]CCE91794.1 hypothetical protein TDEL_0D02100 [Torulaspora delbrueckii]